MSEMKRRLDADRVRQDHERRELRYTILFVVVCLLGMALLCAVVWSSLADYAQHMSEMR